MVNPPFVTGYFYHIYNRGVEKRETYLGKRDYARFLETLEYYRKFPQPRKLSDYRRGVKNKPSLNQKDLVSIACYCLMPNHFHLLVQQLEDGGITTFMRKVSDSYTKYFNTKYERVGSLYQGSFKAKLVESEEYLLQLSKYIHRNSFPLKRWEARKYPYSTYEYYLNGEQHPFCDIDLILSYYSKTNTNLSYQSFVEEFELDEAASHLFIDQDE